MRDPRLYLEDVRESCRKILRYTKGMTLADFLDEEIAYDAVLRNLGIIGEAIKQLPSELRASYTEVNWVSFRAVPTNHSPTHSSMVFLANVSGGGSVWGGLFYEPVALCDRFIERPPSSLAAHAFTEHRPLMAAIAAS